MGEGNLSQYLMGNIKVLVTEIEGEELEFPQEHLLEGNDILFDKTGTSMTSTKISDAIKETFIIANGPPKNFDLQLVLVRSGKTKNSWLYLSDVSFPSNASGWVPPYDVDVLAITFTNKAQPVDVVVEARYRPITDTTDIATTDPLEWSVSPTGPNVIYDAVNASRWAYNLEPENQSMMANRAYGFRFVSPNNVDNAYITIYFRRKL